MDVVAIIRVCGLSGRNGLEAEAPRIPNVKLVLFVSQRQSREHSHAITSLLFVSFHFL